MKINKNGSGTEHLPATIVAECSKNWNNAAGPWPMVPIAVDFQAIIERNRRRGYRLDDWKFFQVLTGPDSLIETIIAVFVKEGKKDAQQQPSTTSGGDTGGSADPTGSPDPA
jgi:hypothetical protein